MFADAFLHDLLNLDDNWIVDDVKINHKGKEIHLSVCYLSEYGKLEPEDNESKVYDYVQERTWRHLDIFQYKCYLTCRLPRIKTESGKVVTLRAPWAGLFKRYTYLFEVAVIQTLLATKNQTKTAAIMRTTFNVVNAIMHNCSKRGMERRDLSTEDIAHLSIDEKMVGKKLKYATILSSPDLGIILDLVDRRTKSATNKLIDNALTTRQQDSVETISLDMWKAYISVCKQRFPKAELVHDKFHLIQYLNKAIDKVRRIEVKTNPVLKKARFVLLKNQENLKESEHLKFKLIEQENLLVSRAWKAREDFKSMCNYKNTKAQASLLLNIWINKTRQISSDAVQKVVNTFSNHFNGVANALRLKYNNAMAERLNGKIQEIKTVSRGYRTFQGFRSAVLFFHGGLDLYPKNHNPSLR